MIRATPFLLVFLLNTPAWAQAPGDEGTPSESGDGLVVHIRTRVLGSSNQVAWEDEINRNTQAGHSVNLQIQGQNFLLKSSLTPYRVHDNRFLLVAQSQIWGTDGHSKTMASTLQTLEVTLSDPVVYLPFGTPDPGKEGHHLLLEITLLPQSEELKVQ